MTKLIVKVKHTPLSKGEPGGIKPGSRYVRKEMLPGIGYRYWYKDGKGRLYSSDRSPREGKNVKTKKNVKLYIKSKPQAIVKAAKGQARGGKYTSRRPDGRGGFIYTYPKESKDKKGGTGGSSLDKTKATFEKLYKDGLKESLERFSKFTHDDTVIPQWKYAREAVGLAIKDAEKNKENFLDFKNVLSHWHKLNAQHELKTGNRPHPVVSRNLYNDFIYPAFKKVEVTVKSDLDGNDLMKANGGKSESVNKGLPNLKFEGKKLFVLRDIDKVETDMATKIERNRKRRKVYLTIGVSGLYMEKLRDKRIKT